MNGISLRFPLFLCLLTFIVGSVHAQSETPAQPDPAAERQRIEAARPDIERTFAAEQAACYRVFFVNSCLNDADERRRSALSALRRQEIFLNEQERKEKAAAQLRKLEEKARPESAPVDVDAAGVAKERERAAQPAKPAPQAAREASPRTPSQSGRSADREKISRDKAQARAVKAADEAAQTREFVERQNKADERRKEHEQAQRNRTKPIARPLPAQP